jgi:hypothetical protein
MNMNMNANANNIKDIFLKLINNRQFILDIDEHITDIMKDNVIDHNDIPSIINIIMDTIYHINDASHNINNDGIKQLILLLIEFIVSKYSINMSENQIKLLGNFIDITINLRKKYKTKIATCFKSFFKCCR